MRKSISIRTKFGWVSAYEQNAKISEVKFGRIKKNTPSKILNKFKKNLNYYFSKKTKKINILYKMNGNILQRRIWTELQKIKYGQTKSYGNIAKRLKLSPRYVGKVCGENKLLLIVPCYRVVRSDGSLEGYSSIGGVNLKKNYC